MHKQGASGKRWSAETEIQKRKNVNESTEVRRKATYQYLVHFKLMLLCVQQKDVQNVEKQEKTTFSSVAQYMYIKS